MCFMEFLATALFPTFVFPTCVFAVSFILLKKQNNWEQIVRAAFPGGIASWAS